MKIDRIVKILEIIGAIITSVITIMDAVNTIRSNVNGIKELATEKEEEPDT